MKNGEKLNYVVGGDGEHYLISGVHNFSDDVLWIAKNTSKNKEVASAGFMVREAGSLTFNKATKKFEFNSQYGVSVPTEDAMALSKKIEKETGYKVEVKKVETGGKAAESKAYECLDVLSAQNSGKNFILNRIVPDNSVAIGGIAVGEALGAGRLQTESGRDVVTADLIGTNLGVVVGGYIGSKLVMSNSSFLTSLGTRAAVSMGMINVQKHVYEAVLSEDATERAEKIATFDQYHFGGRLMWNHMFDKFMVGNTKGAFNLPNMIFKACQNNSRMKFLVNPQSVRFIEKGASAAVYYGLRQSIIGE